MKFALPHLSLCNLLVILLGADMAHGEDKLPDVVEFNRDIRPILAENCYTCHGPDQNKREAELRLDQEEAAIAKRDKGVRYYRARGSRSIAKS